MRVSISVLSGISTYSAQAVYDLCPFNHSVTVIGILRICAENVFLLARVNSTFVSALNDSEGR
jgi:hypothetical protein